jgi:hypothetical protein
MLALQTRLANNAFKQLRSGKDLVVISFCLRRIFVTESIRNREMS